MKLSIVLKFLCWHCAVVVAVAVSNDANVNQAAASARGAVRGSSVEGRRLGEDCGFDEKCNAGLYCHRSHWGEDRCQKKSELGEECESEDWEPLAPCNTGLVCEDSEYRFPRSGSRIIWGKVCMVGVPGRPCLRKDNEDTCGNKLKCIDDVCVLKIGQVGDLCHGSSCANPLLCAGGVCVEEIGQVGDGCHVPPPPSGPIQTGGLCMDMGGQYLTMHGCHGGANQKFYYDSKDRIVGKASRKCLSWDTASNARMHMVDCTLEDNQKWYSDADGFLHSKHDNTYCLSQYNPQRSHTIRMEKCHGGNKQLFTTPIRFFGSIKVDHESTCTNPLLCASGFCVEKRGELDDACLENENGGSTCARTLVCADGFCVTKRGKLGDPCYEDEDGGSTCADTLVCGDGS